MNLAVGGTIHLLQRGHARVSVERSWRAARARSCFWLQRGHARVSVESAGVWPLLKGMIVASTGPRSRERGEIDNRLFSAGIVKLQRGHARVSVESKAARTSVSALLGFNGATLA